MIIKTPRSRVSALIDFALTLLAWIAFGYLFIDGIVSIVEGNTPGLAVPFMSRLLPELRTLLVYVVVAAIIALVLFAWAKYNAARFGGLDRRKTPPALSSEALADSFEISADQLATLRESRRATIHHTPDGLISGIEASDVRGSASVVNLVQRSRTVGD
ncbi:MAG TPA: poly-beta-1,6-N-acetyl-D-glucosamine biosynthesis protein PgaD [Burkholderiaceae bacterium]|nr:poly-beta-1,6-N-acetyl-D-glucosamine biosynthesis protein PgaD [Burkholderiaceae bacterium]